MKRKTLTADIILIVSLVLISVISLGVLLITRQDGDRVVVEINGEAEAEYSLSESGKYILNGGTNTLVIENGTAYVENSHCPDKTCEKSGRISYVGESITCLPNRVTVRIVGKDGVDIVS